MYNLTLENKNGNQLQLIQMGGAYTITEINGLNPPEATINTSSAALMDGEKYNSSKVKMRTVNIAFAIEYEAEKNRLAVYQVLQSKKYVKIIYESEYLSVFAEGYVSSIDISYFKVKQVVTVAITCPFPYFKGLQMIVNELSSLTSTFHFPFASTAEPELVMGYIDPMTNTAVPNNGSVECGLTFELYARASITNPKIYNYLTGEWIGLNYTMKAGDLLTITTGRGEKSVTLLRQSEEINLFNYLMEGITWIQLDIGGSEFVYEVGTGLISNLLVNISHYDLYEGV